MILRVTLGSETNDEKGNNLTLGSLDDHLGVCEGVVSTTGSDLT